MSVSSAWSVIVRAISGRPAHVGAMSADRWYAIADALIVHAESIRQHGGRSA